MLVLTAVACLAALGRGAPSPPDLHELPLLDAGKGRQALRAYRAYLEGVCREHGAPAVFKAFAQAGLPGFDGADPSVDGSPCPDFLGATKGNRALASGSLLKPRADEVLLSVYSGCLIAGPGGKCSALAVLRNGGKGYAFVKYLPIAGASFRARLRIATPGTDALLVCEEHGNMGWYPGTCGLLQDGRLAGNAGSVTLDGPIPLVDQEPDDPETGGPGRDVRLANARVESGQVVLRVVEEDFVAQGTERAARKHVVEKQAWSLVYRIQGGRLQLTQPLPQSLLDATRGSE